MKHLKQFHLNEGLREFYAEFRSLRPALREYGPEDQGSEIEQLIKKHKLSKEDLAAVVARSRNGEFVDYFKYYLENYPEPSEWDDLIKEFNYSILQSDPTEPRYKRFVAYLSSKYELKKK